MTRKPSDFARTKEKAEGRTQRALLATTSCGSGALDPNLVLPSARRPWQKLESSLGCNAWPQAEAPDSQNPWFPNACLVTESLHLP